MGSFIIHKMFDYSPIETHKECSNALTERFHLNTNLTPRGGCLDFHILLNIMTDKWISTGHGNYFRFGKPFTQPAKVAGSIMNHHVHSCSTQCEGGRLSCSESRLPLSLFCWLICTPGLRRKWDHCSNGIIMDVKATPRLSDAPKSFSPFKSCRWALCIPWSS